MPTSVMHGAADQHQVRRPPEGDVLAEEPVPEVVEREADAARRPPQASDQHAADRRVPVAGDLDRGGRPGRSPFAAAQIAR